MPGRRARISCAARSPSSVCVGGIRMSTIATSGSCASTSLSSSSAVPALPADLDPGLLEQRRDSLADRAGCHPRSRPARQLRRDRRAGTRRAGDVEPAVERLDAVGESAQARAAACRRRRRCRRRRSGSWRSGRRRSTTRTDVGLAPSTSRRWRAPRGDEVGGQLKRAGAIAAAVARDGRGDGRSVRQRVERGGRPCSSTAGCIPRASSRSSASDSASSALAVVSSCAASGSSPTRFCSRRNCMAIATSRCCAPSCRLRSSRRRSASPAATIRSRDALSSASRVVGFGQQALVLERDGRRVQAASSSSGSSSSEASCTSAATRRPLRSIGATVRPGPAARGPVECQLEARIAERAPERRLQVCGARRPEPTEEVGEAAARQPRAQQPGQEGQRHRHERAGRDPQQRLRARSADESVTSSVAKHSSAKAPATLGSSARRRGRRRPPPAGATTTTTVTRQQATSSAALDPVDRVGEVRVGEGEQQVALRRGR